MPSLVYACAAAVAFGLSDFLGGFAARRRTALAVIRLTFPLSTAGVFAVALVVPGRPSAGSLVLGAASGLLLAAATAALYAALALGPMSLLSPLGALLTAALPCALGVVFGEALGPTSTAGVAVAGAATVLVGWAAPVARAVPEAPRPSIAAVGLTVGSGVGFAASYACLYAVEAGSGLWPLVSARVTAAASVLMVSVVLLARRRRARIGEPEHRSTTPSGIGTVVVAIAALDVVGNVAVVGAFADGGFAPTLVVMSLFPVVTILAAVTVLGERLRARQLVGVLAALLAAGLIGAAG